MIIEVQRRTHVQQMTYEDFEQRIRDGEIDGRTQVRFEVVTGDRFVPAGELELFQALADPRHMTFRRNLSRTGIPIVTALLIGLQIRVYLASWGPTTELWMEEQLTNWAPAILEQGEVWRLLSYGMLHVGFTHLLFNLCFLAYAGYHLERALGRANLLVLYFGSVFTGGLLSIAMDMTRPSLGASGGDFGLLAASVVVGWKHWDSIPQRARKYFGWALAPYLGFSILSGLNAENVDNWSHLGGLIGGALIVTVIEPEALAVGRSTNLRLRGLVLGLIATISAGIWGFGGNLIPLTPDTESGWTVSRPDYWKQGWTFSGDRGWFSPTLQAALAIATTVHPRPLTADDAAQSLVDRINSNSRGPLEESREAVSLAGLDARRLVMNFDLSGEEQTIVAYVATRGVYEHRVLFQTVGPRAYSYPDLFDRIVDSVRFVQVEELERARQRALMHPRSVEPAEDLGEALYRTGDPQAALRAYDKALSMDPGRTTALVGKLHVYAHYGVPGGLVEARAALAAHPTEPPIVVAAADVMDASDQHDEGVAALDEAWARLPGDRALRRARRRWGLSVALPGEEAPTPLDAPAPL